MSHGGYSTSNLALFRDSSEIDPQVETDYSTLINPKWLLCEEDIWKPVPTDVLSARRGTQKDRTEG